LRAKAHVRSVGDLVRMRSSEMRPTVAGLCKPIGVPIQYTAPSIRPIPAEDGHNQARVLA